MDKLEPIIKHRFWILLGISLPLIIFGYMSANGKMKEATAKREEELNQTLGGIPKGEFANQTYADSLKAINEKFDLEVALAHQAIWEKQRKDMDWPADLVNAGYVPEEYLGDFKQDAGLVYREEYAKLLEEVRQIVDPITRDPATGSLKGKVMMPIEVLPRHTFGELSVSSKEMWEAQEDLWFLRLLLSAVRTENGSAENVAKAPIRMISKVELMGGDGMTGSAAAGTALSSTQGGMFGGEADMSEEYESAGYLGEEESYAGAGGDEGGLSIDAKVEFEPSTEFGKAIAAVSMSTNSTSTLSMSSPMGARAAPEEIRYIAKDDSKPYLERGFYMSLLINQQRIAEFLLTLSNSDWPIRIVRFHVGPNTRAGRGTGASQYNFAGGGMGDAYGESMDDEYGYSDEDFASSYAESMDDAYGGAGYGPPQQSISNDALAGAFSHPDLVQLDVLGAITLYKPLPEDVLAKVTAALGAAAAEADGAATPPPSQPEPAPEGTVDSIEAPVTPAADGETPQTDDGAVAPAAGASAGP